MCVRVFAGVPVKRPSVDELMDPNGLYGRRQVDVSEVWETQRRGRGGALDSGVVYV